MRRACPFHPGQRLPLAIGGARLRPSLALKRTNQTIRLDLCRGQEEPLKHLPLQKGRSPGYAIVCILTEKAIRPSFLYRSRKTMGPKRKNPRRKRLPLFLLRVLPLRRVFKFHG
jgi:hypothetical protein